MHYRPHRYHTQFPVAVSTRFGNQRAVVQDVNGTGARLSGVHHLRRGDKLRLNVLSHDVDAVVVWALRDTVGIVFRPGLNPAMLDTLRYRKDGRRNMGRSTVGFQFAEMR